METNGVNGAAPLTYEGRVIGRVFTDETRERMTVELTTDEGKKLVEGKLVGISSRRRGTVDEDGKVDEGPFDEFTIIK